MRRGKFSCKADVPSLLLRAKHPEIGQIGGQQAQRGKLDSLFHPSFGQVIPFALATRSTDVSPVSP